MIISQAMNWHKLIVIVIFYRRFHSKTRKYIFGNRLRYKRCLSPRYSLVNMHRFAMLFNLYAFQQAFALPTTIDRRGSLGFHTNNKFETMDGTLYNIERELGTGAFGVVLLAYPLDAYGLRNWLLPEIAIKKIIIDSNKCINCDALYGGSDQFYHPYECEVATLKYLGRLVSPPIFSRSGGSVYIANTLIPGIDIHQFYKKYHSSMGRSHLKPIYDAAYQSLQKLHSLGVSHGDSHVANFLIDYEAEGASVSVEWIDFGKSKLSMDLDIPDLPSACRLKNQTDAFQQDITRLELGFKRYQEIYSPLSKELPNGRLRSNL